MRLTDDGLDTYLASVADLLDRYGLELDSNDQSLTIDQSGDARRLGVRALLPEGASTGAVVEIRETWVTVGAGVFERVEYAYELIDDARDVRRAFHLHFQEWFERRFLVVVHEHCEHPIGEVRCGHYEGSPIRDAFAGVMALIDAWTAEPADCAALRCLE